MSNPKLLDHVGAPGSPRALLLKGLVVATLSASCARQPQTGPNPQPAVSPIPWATIQPPTQVGVPAGTPGASPSRLPIRTFRGTGLIRSINLKEGWFEIDHEEIAGYMPAMTMQWKVRNGSMLKSVSVGDKVDFELKDDNGSEVITVLKKARGNTNEK